MTHLTKFKEPFPWNAARPDGALVQLYTPSDVLVARLLDPTHDVDAAHAWLRAHTDGFYFHKLIKCADGYVLEATSH